MNDSPTSPAGPASPNAGARAVDAGMSLLELLVVAGILAMLMGLGVGMLRRGDGVAEARSALVGQLRLAALDARTRALPTEVILAPGVDGMGATVSARGLDPALLVTFEPGQSFATAGVQPAFGGDADPMGRCGQGRRPGQQDKSALMRVPLGPGAIDLRAGFAVRFDVRLHRRSGGRLLRLGRGIDLAIDDEARPYARLMAEGTEGRAGAAINLKAATGLPLGRWCTVELATDGTRAWCSIDGRVVADQDFAERVLQQKEDVFEVGPGDQPVDATFDELQLFAYAWTQPMRLPDSILLGGRVRIAFDAMGEPVAPPEIKLEVAGEQRTEVLRVGAGGVLQ
ncbi:MAG: Tfp pilus assembly protein FimT/FimU [Planctomycetota bacterium]